MTFVFQLVAGWEAIQDMNYTGEDDGEQEGATKRHAAKIGLFLCDWEPGLFLAYYSCSCLKRCSLYKLDKPRAWEKLLGNT